MDDGKTLVDRGNQRNTSVGCEGWGFVNVSLPSERQESMETDSSHAPSFMVSESRVRGSAKRCLRTVLARPFDGSSVLPFFEFVKYSRLFDVLLEL